MPVAPRHLAVLFAPASLLLIAVLTPGHAADSKEPPRLVAKSPPPAASPVPQTARTQSPPSKEASAPTVIAQAYPLIAPVGATSAQLLDMALDYGWFRDGTVERQRLQLAAEAGPGSTAAGLALVLLASRCAGTDPLQSQALYAQANTYADRQVQACAALVQEVDLADREKRWQDAIGLLSAAAAEWKGAFLGGWATVKLGTVYWDELNDYEQAKKVFAAAVADNVGPLQEQAAIELAQTTAFAGNDPGGALGLAKRALEAASEERFRRTGLWLLGSALQDVGEHRQAMAVFSQVIEQWPDHPAARYARTNRSVSAYALGDLTAAADDAEIYLTLPNLKPSAVSFSHLVLANRAFRDGDYARAESEFSILLNSPNNSEWLGPAHNGLAQCRSARGDLHGALSELLLAADSPVRPSLKALYLYGAALAAERLGDQVSVRRIADRMELECPGSHLTSKLLGREVLSAPGI